MVNRILYSIISLLVVVVFLLYYFLQRIPSSDSFSIEGIVVSKSTNQGLGSSGDRLTVDTDQYGNISVSNDFQVGVIIGDKVSVIGYERYIFGPRFVSVKKIDR